MSWFVATHMSWVSSAPEKPMSAPTCMVHARCMHGACTVYARCMHGVCMVYARCMHGVCVALLPMRAPTVVSSVLDSMKPSAHRAQPEAELRQVITTGTSAPPIARVACAPTKSEVAVHSASASRPAATVGDATSREIVHRLTAEAAALTQLRLGSAMGEEPMRPLSFAKATSDPVVVIPPR